MKRIVKTLAFITLSVLSVNAQLKLPVANGIAPDIRKVIEDYPNHFNNLAGDLIDQQPQSTDYQCNFKVHGAEEATITKYTSKKHTISSWQALMLTTESFDEAKKKFRSLYTQLNNLSVKPNAAQTMHLKGVYEAPTDEKKFNSVLLSFENAGDGLKKLKVEIVMQYEPMEWKVRVLIYEKQREDDERGDVIED